MFNLTVECLATLSQSLLTKQKKSAGEWKYVEKKKDLIIFIIFSNAKEVYKSTISCHKEKKLITSTMIDILTLF